MKFLLMTSYSNIGSNDAPAMGLYRLRHVLKKIDVDCEVLDLAYGDLDQALVRTAAGEYTVIGMSVTHYHMAEDLEVLARFREALAGHPAYIIAGGQEATHNYRQWLSAGIDFIFLGYAEQAIVKFAGLCELGEASLRENITAIDGIAYLDREQPVFQPAPPLTYKEFERLQFDNVLEMDVPFHDYWENARKNSEGLNFGSTIFVPETVRLYTSTHCPNRCGFCSSHRFLSFAQQQPASLFTLKADQIMQLMLKFINDYGATSFLFGDDDFLVDRKRIISLCEMVIAKKESGSLPSKLMLNCQARISDFLDGSIREKRINAELIEKMAQAGFHSIGLGIETFSERLLSCPSMTKKGFLEKDCHLVVDALLDKGIVPQINIIIFIPDATVPEVKHSIEESLEYVARGCQIAVTPFLHAVPGAPIYNNENLCVHSEKTRGPINGIELDISSFFEPDDAQLTESANNFEECFSTQLVEFRKRYDWTFERIPKTAVGLLMFNTVAELLDSPSLVTLGWEILGGLF